jgi:hypothetical protein
LRIKHLKERSPKHNNLNKSNGLVEQEDQQVDYGQIKSVTQDQFGHTTKEVKSETDHFTNFKTEQFGHTSKEVKSATEHSESI